MQRARSKCQSFFGPDKMRLATGLKTRSRTLIHAADELWLERARAIVACPSTSVAPPRVPSRCEMTAETSAAE